MRIRTTFVPFCLLCVVCLAAASASAQDSSSKSQAPSAGAASAKASSQPASTPSASEIAAAKASHKVWVNLDSGVYHKGSRWYGKTKNGKFMTEDEAKRAGYKPARRE